VTDSKTTFLFDGTPAAKELARRNDPEESKKAAREIVPHLGKIHREVLELVRQHPDHTQAELHWDVMNAASDSRYMDSRRIGRRLSELAAQGKVYKSGSRKCHTTGHTAATWRVCR
jgi:hypothetical protein